MSAFTPHQAAVVLRARWHVMLAVFLAIVLTTLVVSLLLPKKYLAQASVLVDSSKSDLMTGGVTSTEADSAFLVTQVDVLRSHRVALRVVDKLKLDNDPAIEGQFRSKTGGNGNVRDWIAQAMELNLDVLPSRQSNVLNIDYYAGDPRVAAALANAFADAYVQTDLELKNDSARRQSGWFQLQLADLRKTLETAQKRLSDYQGEHRVLAGSETRLDAETSRLTDIAGQLVAAQAQAGDGEAKLRQMKQATDLDHVEQLPEVMANPLLQGMKADLTRAEGRFADVASRLAPNHPQYISAQAEIRKLKDQLQAELANTTGSIRQSAEIARQRVAELQRAMDEQKAHIIQIQQQLNDMDVLTRDVQSAQHTYEAAVQRAETLGLEGRNDQPAVSVLDVASIPISPARPRVALNVALAVILGALLAVAAAFAAERLDRRVRTTRDLLESAHLPVIGEIPRLLLAAPNSAWGQG